MLQDTLFSLWQAHWAVNRDGALLRRTTSHWIYKLVDHRIAGEAVSYAYRLHKSVNPFSVSASTTYRLQMQSKPVLNNLLS